MRVRSPDPEVVMHVMDAHWELENLGRKTVELSLDKSDLDESYAADLDAALLRSDYAVARVGPDALPVVWQLESRGFTFRETQLTLSKSLVGLALPDVSTRMLAKCAERRVVGHDAAVQLASHIEPDMFTTDRVAMDKALGPELGARRYRNWVTQAALAPETVLLAYERLQDFVGFSMLKLVGEQADLLLAGCGARYRGLGFGLVAIAGPMRYAAQQGARHVRTRVSSNNVAVINAYVSLAFRVEACHTVLVRHRGAQGGSSR